MRWPSKTEALAARDWLIYVTNMTWGAFYVAFGLSVWWPIWNAWGPIRFDPPPFVALGVVITVITWLQGILILIRAEEQRRHSARQETASARQDEMQTQMLTAVLHIAEAIRDRLVRDAPRPDPAADSRVDGETDAA